MNHQISASILSADFADLGNEVQKVLKSGADRIHIDVMDQHYVPNLTVGPIVLKSLVKKCPNAFYEVHLMAENIDALIHEFAKAGANLICFHPEINPHTHRSLNLIRSLGCESGLVINPGVSLEYIKPVLSCMDYLLVMSVNPGFGGQTFIRESLKTIEAAKKIIQTHSIRLAVDGGISEKTIGDAVNAGADVLISGSAIFASNHYGQAIQKMRSAISAAEGI